MNLPKLVRAETISNAPASYSALEIVHRTAARTSDRNRTDDNVSKDVCSARIIPNGERVACTIPYSCSYTLIVFQCEEWLQRPLHFDRHGSERYLYVVMVHSDNSFQPWS